MRRRAQATASSCSGGRGGGPVLNGIAIGVWAAILAALAYSLRLCWTRYTEAPACARTAALLARSVSLYLWETFLFLLAAACFETCSCFKAGRQNPWFTCLLTVLVGVRATFIYRIVCAPVACGDGVIALFRVWYLNPPMLFAASLALLFLGLTLARVVRDGLRLPPALRGSRLLLVIWLVYLTGATFCSPVIVLLQVNQHTDRLGLVVFAERGEDRALRHLLNASPHAAAGRVGKEALLKAAAAGQAVCVRMLLDAGTPVDARAPDGSTPLMCSMKLGYYPARQLAAARCLTEGGADVDARDEEGRTALMQAADAGNVAAVRFLLERGANRQATSNAGLTALDLARRRLQARGSRALASTRQPYTAVISLLEGAAD